jgi:two-component system OmpR family response regulator
VACGEWAVPARDANSFPWCDIGFVGWWEGSGVQTGGERVVRVLLVEDDEDNRELMTEVLEGAGFRVLSASSGNEGLRALSEHSVDVVITDVGMPGMGGLEVARAAKRIAPTVPVLLVTGYTVRDDILSARGHEVDAVLVKPVDPDALAATVGDIVQPRAR